MERQREAAGGAPAGGHVTWARRHRNQSRISCVGGSSSALNGSRVTDLKHEVSFWAGQKKKTSRHPVRRKRRSYSLGLTAAGL